MNADRPRAVFGKSAVLTASIAVLIAAPWKAEAQFEITTGVGNTAQNFDSLITTGSGTWTNDTTLAPDDSTLNGWSLFNSLNTPLTGYVAGTGSDTGGSFYSFGATDATERALGGLGSGGTYFGSPASGAVAGYIAFAATNTSAATLTGFTLGFNGEQWRNSGNTSAQPMVLEYGFGSTFDTVTWTAPGGNFDWNSPVIGTPAAAVDGNVAGRVATRGGTIGGLNWTTGQTLWIRWIERNDTGNDHGLAIDDFAFSWVGAAVTLQYWDTNGSTAGIGGSGNWSSASLTWNLQANGQGAPQVFDSNNPLIFGGVAGTVTIAAAGVTANQSLRFDTSGYTIAASGAGKLTLNSSGVVEVVDGVLNTNISAPISGSAGLIKTGDGALQLSGTNDFSGVISLNDGALRIDRPDNLGNNNNDLTFAGGALNPTASMTLGNGRTLSGSGKLDIPSGTTLTIQGDVTMASLELLSPGTFSPAGATQIGTLTFQSAATVANTGAINLTSIDANHTTGTATINGPVVLAASGARVIDVADSDAAIDLAILGDITLGGTGGNTKLHKRGPGTLDLLGANNSAVFGTRLGTAGAPMTDGGTLIIHNKDSLGSNEFQFNNGVLQVAVPLTGANAIPSTVRVSLGGGGSVDTTAVITGSPVEFAGDLMLFNNFSTGYPNFLTVNTDVTFSGLFVASTALSAGLTVKGSGSLTFPNPGAGTHTVAEPIFVDGPSVTINGSLSATAAVTVLSGRFSGNTQIAGPLFVGDSFGTDDAIVSPGGNGIGSISAAFLTLDRDAVLQLQINSSLATPEADKITLAGLITFLDAGADMPKLVVSDLGNATLSAPLTITIIENTVDGGTTGKFEGLPDGSSILIGNNLFRIDYKSGPGANDVALVLIPEPTAISGLLVGAGLLGLRRRRRAVS